MISGNSQQQASLRQALLSPRRSFRRVVSCSGRAHLGKASFARELLSSELHEVDFLEMQPGVDGAREAVEFSRTDPVGGETKAILVDDADRLGEPAQDALLKLCEEPPPHLAVVLIAHDPGHLQPALLSRVREDVRWLPLGADEMSAVASSLLLEVSGFALGLACGLPGMYRVIAETGGFEELASSVGRAMRGELSVLEKPPKVISDLENGPGSVRDAVVHVLWRTALTAADNSRAAGEVLRMCGVLSGSTSANAEIHWTRMVSQLSV